MEGGKKNIKMEYPPTHTKSKGKQLNKNKLTHSNESKREEHKQT